MYLVFVQTRVNNSSLCEGDNEWSAKFTNEIYSIAIAHTNPVFVKDIVVNV